MTENRNRSTDLRDNPTLFDDVVYYTVHNYHNCYLQAEIYQRQLSIMLKWVCQKPFKCSLINECWNKRFDKLCLVNQICINFKEKD